MNQELDPSVTLNVLGPILTFLASIFGALITSHYSNKSARANMAKELQRQKEKLDFEREKLTLQLRHEREKLDLEYKLQFRAEMFIVKFLSDPAYPQRKRSFKEIKRRLHGFEPNELRQLLIRSGAVCYGTPDTDSELWALFEGLSDSEKRSEAET